MLKVLLSTLLLSASLFAADEVKVADPVYQEAGYNFLGASVGVARIAGTNMDLIPTRFAYALEFNHAYTQQLAVGAFVSRNDGNYYNSDVGLALTRVGVQALYTPLYDLILSLKAGIGFGTISKKVAGMTISIQDDSNPFFVAPGFGIIFPITEKIQFIPNLSYAFFLKNNDTASFQVFDAMGTFRFQF